MENKITDKYGYYTGSLVTKGYKQLKPLFEEWRKECKKLDPIEVRLFGDSIKLAITTFFLGESVKKGVDVRRNEE